MTFTPALTEELFNAIEAANLGRHEANAAEPYVHADYAAHEDRLNRLVAVLADGDEQLEYSFREALFDITFDGPVWLRNTFGNIKRELEAERADEAAAEAADLEDLRAAAKSTDDHAHDNRNGSLCAVCGDDHRPHADCPYCKRYRRACGRIHFTPETSMRTAMDALRAFFATCYPSESPDHYGVAAARMLDLLDTLPDPVNPTSPANAVEIANAMHYARVQIARLNVSGGN